MIDDKDAFRQGRRAAQARQPRSSCPYKGEGRQAWCNGWLSGVEDWLETPEADAWLDALWAGGAP